MNVFLCWSGERSKNVAEKLKDWLPQIIQAVEPWMSPDIEKGARWGSEIADRLEKTKVGIICLTRENLDNRWILFEAGSLSKTKDARPCTFLLDIAPADVEPPLSQFQHTESKKEEVLKLLQTINSKVEQVGENAISQEVLDNLFEVLWPQLEQELLAISQQQEEIELPLRSESEKLDELLALVRALGRQIERLSGYIFGEEKNAEKNIVDRYQKELLRFLAGKGSWTTFAELQKELGLSRGVIHSMVNALESLGYVTVERGGSYKMFISIDNQLFFGEHIENEIKVCLQELAADASKNPAVRKIVENLPEEAVAHFEKGDLFTTTRIYNEAVKRLAEAEIRIFPLIEWRRKAYKISLGSKFHDESR